MFVDVTRRDRRSRRWSGPMRTEAPQGLQGARGWRHLIEVGRQRPPLHLGHVHADRMLVSPRFIGHDEVIVCVQYAGPSSLSVKTEHSCERIL